MSVVWLDSLRGFLFPYRTHLEEEVDYLRAQLAQRQRRIDELQESLIEAKTPRPPAPRPEPKPMPPVKPRGWEKMRTSLYEAEAKKEQPDGQSVA